VKCFIKNHEFLFIDTPFGDGTVVGQWFVGNVVYTVRVLCLLETYYIGHYYD